MLACGREHRSAVRQHREGVFGRVRLLDGGIGLGVAGGRVTVAVWLHVHVGAVVIWWHVHVVHGGCRMVACTCWALPEGTGPLPYGCMTIWVVVMGVYPAAQWKENGWEEGCRVWHARREGVGEEKARHCLYSEGVK